MAAEQRVTERIAREFSPGDRPLVTEILNRYSGPEAERVAWDILVLSKGRLDLVRRYAENARIDYRDVLYWAEYYDSDPMLGGREPRVLVDEILAKWGKRGRR